MKRTVDRPSSFTCPSRKGRARANILYGEGMMPLFRYSICMGSLLLTVILLSEHFISRPREKERADVDRTVIRITSGVRLPDLVVIDTSLPTISSPVAEIADAAKQKEFKITKLDALASIHLPPPAVRKSQKNARLRKKSTVFPPSPVVEAALVW